MPEGDRQHLLSPCTRIWLDLQQPCLPQAIGWLIDRSTSGQLLDLSTTTCVLPGRRAGRLLLDGLLRVCKKDERSLLPPAVITPGDLPSVLADNTAARATSLELQMAWTQALREIDATTLATLLPHPPDDDATSSWLVHGRQLQQLENQLTGECVLFDDVQYTIQHRNMIREEERWQVLAKLQKRVIEKINAAGLIHPTQLQPCQTIPPTAEHIVLVATPELATQQKQLLAESPGKCTALIHADSTMRDGFDVFGCVISDYWKHRTINIADDDLLIVERVPDQPQVVLRELSTYATDYPAEHCIIGLGDETLGRAMQLAAARVDVKIHLATGNPLPETRPLQLLKAIAAWLREPRFAHFAAMIRQTDLEQLLIQQTKDDGKVVTDWAELLDRYFSDHLQVRIDGNWLGSGRSVDNLKIAYQTVCKLLAPLMSNDTQPLAAWGEPLLQVLRNLFGHLNLQSTSPEQLDIIGACEELQKLINHFAMLPPAIDVAVDATTALEHLIASAAEKMIAEPAEVGQVEVMGWLELHLDPSPVMFICSMTEGMVPETVQGDAFLPDALRVQLGVRCNADRFARDAYLIEAIRTSRDVIRFIVPRIDDRGEPLPPSRLLLSGHVDDLPGRILQLSDDETSWSCTMPAGVPQPRNVSSFTIPKPPQDIPPIESMRVTAFRAYLECPYRFWLSYIERLRATSDFVDELDPLAFGTLAHAVLQQFGSDTSIRDSTQPKKIAAYFDDTLDTLIRNQHGKGPLPAVAIQVARLRQRLAIFAERQADMRREGWQITFTELELPETTHLDMPDPGNENVDTTPMKLTGKIDRIDQHESTGRWRLIDYKTSESGKTPEETHGPKDGEWTDLQIPLYDHLFRTFIEPGTPATDMELAYIVLPKKPADVQLRLAEWSAEERESAVDVAREVVRQVRSCAFAMSDFSSPWDPFARICQSTAYSAEEDDPRITESEGDDD